MDMLRRQFVIRLSDGIGALVDRSFPVSDEGQEFVYAPPGLAPKLFTCLAVFPRGLCSGEVLPVEIGGPFPMDMCYPLLDLVKA